MANPERPTDDIDGYACPPSPSPLPTDDAYEVLKMLARRRNLQIVDVPGDGDCFFHAVSVSLPAAGVQAIPGPEIRAQLIQYLQTTEAREHYSGFQSHDTSQTGTTIGNTPEEEQHQQYQSYIDGLKNGEWADNVAVQAVAEMLNINITVINTTTPDWPINVHPRRQTSHNTITIGQIGELHFVELKDIDADIEVSKEQAAISKTQELEDEEDRIAFEQASKLRGIPYETLLQEEQVTEGDNIYSIAPGENQTPCAFLTDHRFEELANPAKYPYGRGGFGDKDKRQKEITPRKFFNQRLLHKDGRFAKDIEYLLTAQYIVEAKQVRDNIQINLRQTRGHTFQNKKINAGLVKNLDNVQAMLRTDSAFKFLQNIRGSPAYWNSVLLDLLAMVRQLGIPTWFLTLSAADMQWPEVIQSIAHQYGKHLTADDVKSMAWQEKCDWLRCNPVTAARQFHHRLTVFFNEFIGGKANPIGKLKDYMIRIEFQARGSPHAHTILWMEDAPKLGVDSDADVVNFINKHQTCAIPDEEEEDLRHLVLSLQKHVHSSTCRKAGSCRFRFPHPPSTETMIGRPSDEANATAVQRDLKVKEEVLRKVRVIMDDKNVPEDVSLAHLLQAAKVDQGLYHQALKLTKSGEQIVLRRQPSERNINNYNRWILKTWRANMDLQFIRDPYSCIMYITSYMLKSERAMSELLKKVLEESRGDDLKSKLRNVGSAFLKNREASAQEAAYRLLSLPLKIASRKVVFVNTAPKDKRVSMLKPRNELDRLKDDDENIFCPSPLDRYASRPSDLDSMSLAEFMATYKKAGKELPEDSSDHTPDVLDGQDETHAASTEANMYPPPVITLGNKLGQMKRRKQHCIIRFHQEKKDDEERYRNLLMLYFPWRNEDLDIKANFPSFKQRYEHVIDTVRHNEAKFSINADAVNAAYDDLQQNGPPVDVCDSVAPNVQFEQAEQEAEGITVESEMSEEDQRNNVDLVPHPTSNNSSELHARFTAELNKECMSSAQYRGMMRSLNHQQMEVIKFHRKWCKDTILALKQHQPIPQYTVFLSGPGGVGKSHVIKLVQHETVRLLKPLYGAYFDPNDLLVLLTAFTGTAAFGINGMTLHSAFSLSCGRNRGKDYQPLSSDKLNTLRSRLGKLKLLIVDEVSMVGADLLYHIHRRLQDISGNPDPDTRFGGVSILAVGDLFQLQPVGQNHVFALPSDSYAKLHGSLWEENFRLMELTESMRQKEDQNFANLLTRVRTASCTEEDINLLKSRVITRTDPSYPSEALHVFKTNKEVDKHNAKHLTTLSSKVFDIKAIDSKKDLLTGLTNVAMPTKPSDTSNLREVVSVAVGARVMVTVNIDVADGLVNGTIATVVGIDSTGPYVHTILVKFDSDRVGKQAIAESQYKQAYPGAVPSKGKAFSSSLIGEDETRAFRAERIGRGGGVMNLAKQDVNPTDLHIAVQGLEHIATTVTKASTTVNIINIYRPPSLPEAVFIGKLQNLLHQLPWNIMTVILGDFNFDLLKCPPPQILPVMRQFGFSQQVQVPTTDYGTLLDHVYVRGHGQDSVQVSVQDTYYTDHDMFSEMRKRTRRLALPLLVVLAISVYLMGTGSRKGTPPDSGHRVIEESIAMPNIEIEEAFRSAADKNAPLYQYDKDTGKLELVANPRHTRDILSTEDALEPEAISDTAGHGEAEVTGEFQKEDVSLSDDVQRILRAAAAKDASPYHQQDRRAIAALAGNLLCKVKATCYKALVRPHLEYSATVWDPYTIKGMQAVEAVQRRAARVTFNDYRRTSSVTQMLDELQWPLLSERRRSARLTTFYKIWNSLPGRVVTAPTVESFRAGLAACPP
ncbi:hypothetical protein Bbelb_304250 [Branchiostoma belcheri]|nr:hypothetical protein Bbelb_304250 [Branchiostoma belcheri]